MRIFISLIIFISLQSFLYCEGDFFDDINMHSNSENLNKGEHLLYEIDFSKYSNGNATNLLKKLGFELKMGASKMNPTIKNSRLYIGDNKGHVAFFVKEFVYGTTTRLKIIWGVDKFTSNEKWEQGKQSNAIGFAVSFGREKIDSGTWYVPNMPRFIGYFISKTAKIRKTYVGEHFKLGGKLLCISNSTKEVTSDLDLVSDFEKEFPKLNYIPVSGFSIQANTKGSKGSLAYIKKIQFFGFNK
ncbi:MAG: hypothetical protein COB02_07185 [Candidatus Cloacimonadota bacterium]|nr:MAG: hypothetical protein COB02_07185 [Candidatus Cloacimonadota bacterium]